MARFVLTAQLQLQAPNNVGQIVSQIQNQLNGINVNLQVQGSARAQQQIQQVTQSCNQATTAADRMGRAFAVSIRRFAAFSIATRAVGLFTSTLSDAIQTSIDFERQLVKVAQVTGKNVSDLRDLTNEITNLSTGLGVSSQSLLDVTTILTQAGLTANDTKIALNSLAKAALAPNFDSITQTAEGAIAILAQFKLGVGALEAQLGSINAVAGAFAVEASDLIDVIRRTGGVFKSSGGDLNELLALFTSVRATTRESAESIGTGLRTIFTRIQRPETIEFLKQFGVELVDLEGKFVGPYEAIKRLSGALTGLGERDLGFIKIAEELGGFRQIGKVLPLLQQFSTAEAALNVATNANNSLTQDAISAQAALAVRIMKVREEFLALVRSITETPTFQIMANTALTLASALIKVADSIKPLLPLLTAVAAFRALRGVGTFVGSAVAGLQSGRTFNQGGRVHRFATGGLVPGVGNSDTVPAMLSPGEFVIRKSSVQSLGASNLAGMNRGGSVRKYAIGGKVGAIALNPIDGSGTATATLTTANILNALATNNQLPGGTAGNQALLGKTGDFKDSASAKRKEAPDGLTFRQRTERLVSKLAFNGKNQQKITAVGASFPSTKNSETPIESSIKQSITNAYNSIIPETAKQLQALVGSGVTAGSPNPSIVSSIGVEDAAGKIFEGAVSSLGAPFDNNYTKGDRDAFDFPQGIGSNLAKFSKFKELQSIPTDAKKSLGKNLEDIASRKTTNYLAGQVNQSGAFQSLKARAAAAKGMDVEKNPKGPRRKKHFGGIIEHFATGGNVGTDTVPALLTPGEFVVNKASAQRIGYSSLGRMNRVGKYANGGIVQRFNTGTTGTGVQPATGGGNPMQPPVYYTTAGGQGTQGGQGVQRTTNQLGMAISLVSASMQAMIPPITDTSSSMEKFGNSILSMITTMGGLIFALESMNVAVSASTVAQFFGTGSGGLGSIIKNFGTQTQSAVGSLVGRMSSFGNVIARNTGSFGAGVKAGLTGANPIASASMQQLSGPRATIQQRLNGAISPNYIARGGNLSTVGRMTARAGGDIGGIVKSFGNIGSVVANLFSPLTGAIGKVVSGLIGFTGPLAAAYVAFSVVNAAIAAFSDAAIKQKQAIEKGDVAGAGAAANANYDVQAGIVGLLAPSLSEAFTTLFGGNTRDSVVSLAQAQAQATKTQKAFEQGEKDAAKAMEDFNNGTITATDALGRISQVAIEAQNLREANDKAIEANNKNKSEGTASYLARGAASFLTLGYVESQSTRNDRIDRENKALDKSSLDADKKAFDMARPMRNEVMREGILQGLSQEDINKRIESKPGGKGSAKLNAEGLAFANKSIEARNRGDNETADKFMAQSEAAYEQAKEQEDSYRNLTREIDAAKKKFEAINLGFRSVVANSDAAALAMTNLSASFEVGALPVQQAAATLEAALTSAGQNISKAQFDDALKNVTTTFESLGASQEQVDKFKGAMEGIAGVQRNFPAIFEQMKNQIKNGGLRSMSANDAGKAFKDIVDKQLEGAGIGEATRKQIVDSMGEVKLSQEDMNKIDSGDYSVLEKYLGDAGEEASKVLKNVVDNMAKVNQELISVTKLRIEAERNLVEAQKDALALTLEGRELQGKYGGKAVTNEERRQNILARSNANGIGPAMKTGSLAEIRARNNAMSGLFGATEQQRRVKNGMAGAAGVEADEAQKNIQKAQKDQINTIRELVKLEEENLKLIGEKNKLEKDSIDALVSGDIDKFMQSQATIGATAAIATGNKSLMNAFGSEALGAAAMDIRRQQEAGVGSLYGRQLSGQGGLTQQAYGAALSSRGITDPRYAQIASGNTAEEEASKSRLRDLGTALDETGQLGVQMAEMQVETANLRVNEAKIEVAKFVNGGADAVAKANGGLIYASRGMFIPRGTDTVPAMLTPGEFVVRREAVNRGNNLQILQQMNGMGGGMTSSSEVMGFARGGRVQYYSAGSSGPIQQQSSSSSINGDNFINQLSKQLDRLENLVVKHQLGDNRVTVDITGGEALRQMAGNIEKSVRNSVSQQLSNSYATENGIGYNGSVLGQA